MMQLLIATGNLGKLREIQALLEGLDIELVIPADLGLSQDVEETGKTYAENAAIKALACASSAGLVTLADDSGLEVDALSGLPGVRSARFAPQPGATDADRRAYLLDRLKSLPQPWKAHFHCTVAVRLPRVRCALPRAGVLGRSSVMSGGRMVLAMTRSSSFPNWERPWRN